MVNGEMGTRKDGLGWAGGWPLFVYGWREVFVPLVVLMHNQHGPSLAVAGLAIAATRLGGWLVHKTSLRRPLAEASLLCGVALLFLGLAPEEGPISLLLWFLFGLGWPALQSGLAGRLWKGWAGLAALLVGMAAAGPLVRGPGTWIIAAGCMLLAWQARQSPAPQAENPQAEPVVERNDWTPFLFSVVYLAWVWLLPLRLSLGTLAPEVFAVVMAAGWLARSLTASAIGPSRPDRSRWIIDPAAALLLIPVLAVIALAQSPALVAAAFILLSALLGAISNRPGIARGELGQLPGPKQALGEWTAPLVGAVLVLLAGPMAVFAAAGLAAAAMAWTTRRH